MIIDSRTNNYGSIECYGVELPPNKNQIPFVPSDDVLYTVQIFNLRNHYADDFKDDEIDTLYDQYLHQELNWYDSEENKSRTSG